MSGESLYVLAGHSVHLDNMWELVKEGAKVWDLQKLNNKDSVAQKI